MSDRHAPSRPPRARPQTVPASAAATAATATAVLLAGLLVLLIVAALAPTAAASEHAGEGTAADHAPTLVYEKPGMSPLKMGYEEDTKTFRVHPGWVNDKKIFYYKFMMYTPGTYPNASGAAGGPVSIPVAPVYLPTTDGTFAGVPDDQLPILRYLPSDDDVANETYSDFVQVHFVNVSADHDVNALRSVRDVLDAVDAGDADLVETDIVVNLPVVPDGSSLQAPDLEGTAPIEPLMAWWRGVQVQTFAFEATDQAAADWINARTRPADAAEAEGFESVVSRFATPDRVRFAPIFHLNQLWTGVTPGVNNGGPAIEGQQNVLDVDRPDPAYSPLWQVIWATQVPVGYRADQASHRDQLTEANGFRFRPTPMFVNCPNVGPRGGGHVNPDKAPADAFQAHPALAPDTSYTIEGALVMQGGVEVSAVAGGTTLATATTNVMGGYVLDISAADLGPGDHVVQVLGPDDAVAAEFPRTVQGAEEGVETGAPKGQAPLAAFAMLAIMAAAVVLIVPRLRE